MKITPPTPTYVMEVGRGFVVAIRSHEPHGESVPRHRVVLLKDGEDEPFCTVVQMEDGASAKQAGRFVAHGIQAVFYRMDEDEASGAEGSGDRT